MRPTINWRPNRRIPTTHKFANPMPTNPAINFAYPPPTRERCKIVQSGRNCTAITLLTLSARALYPPLSIGRGFERARATNGRLSHDNLFRLVHGARACLFNVSDHRRKHSYPLALTPTATA